MAMTRTYLSIDGQITSEMRAGETRSRDYVLDPLGNVMGVYQADWAVAYMSFDPWGELLSGWNADSYKFAWCGGWGYRRTGLEVASHYVRARHYSFLDGSWTTVDPLWPGERAYGYVGGRVTAAVDPSGLRVRLCTVVMAIAGHAPQTTTDGYSHVKNDQKLKWMSRYWGQVSTACSPEMWATGSSKLNLG